MTIKDATRQLGLALAEDEGVAAFNAAKRAYDRNEELSALLGEYRAERTLLGEIYAKTDTTPEENAAAEKMNARVAELAGQIRAHEAYIALEAAQETVNALMEQVNRDISFYAFGELPEGCTHDCSTCGGCGH